MIEFGGGLDDEPAAAGDPPSPEPGSVPRLRVAGELDEPMPEPAQQVAEIQQALVELHEEFQPAGSIGPEVELDFDQIANPFGETFEEEQIVVNRYAKLPAGRQPLSYAKQADFSAVLPAAATAPAARAEPQRPAATVESGGQPPGGTVEFGGPTLSEVVEFGTELPGFDSPAPGAWRGRCPRQSAR